MRTKPAVFKKKLARAPCLRAGDRVTDTFVAALSGTPATGDELRAVLAASSSAAAAAGLTPEPAAAALAGAL